MDLTRRDFLRVAGATSVAGVLFAGCAIPEREIIKQSPRDLPEDLAQGLEDMYATACVSCGEGHGILVRVAEGRAKKIEGNPDHPLNRGALLPGCLAGVQSLYHPDRFSGPMASGQNITWANGLSRLNSLLDGADASRTLLITRPNRGHLGAVIHEFAQGAGIRHLQLEPLENTAVRQAAKDVFGQDQLPFFDIANAGSLLSIGADFLESWLAPIHYSRAYGNFRRGEGRSRGTHIHAGTRYSMTAANADTWLPIAPGREGILALSIAYVLAHEGLADEATVNAMTGGLGEVALAPYRPDALADQLGATPGVITGQMITDIARNLASHGPAVVLVGGSAAAQPNGLFNAKAGMILNGVLGSVGRRGGVQFNSGASLPELQGLPSPTTYSEWRDVRDRLDRGDIDLVLVDGSNPVHALASLKFGQALRRARNVVSFSYESNETTAMADLVLPDQHYLESWGTDVPNPGPGYEVLTVQQPVAAPLIDSSRRVVYDSRALGDVLISVMQSRGISRTTRGDSMEQVVLNALANLHAANPGRGSVQGSTLAAFTTGVLQRGGWWNIGGRGVTIWQRPLFDFGPGLADMPERIAEHTDRYHLIPFASSTVGDGSAGHLPWTQSAPDPVTSMVWHSWVEVNSREAARLGLRDGDLVELQSENGAVEVPVYFHPGIPPNVVAVPFGRGRAYSGRYGDNPNGNVATVLGDVEVEGTGSLAWGATTVTIRPLGRRMRMARMEGGFTGEQLEGTHIIQLEYT